MGHSPWNLKSVAIRVGDAQVAQWREDHVEIVDALTLLGVPGEVRSWGRVRDIAAAKWLELQLERRDA
jgi:hypothetical protein